MNAVNTFVFVHTYFGLHVLRKLQDGVHSGPRVWVILQVSQDFLCQPLLGYKHGERKRKRENKSILYIHSLYNVFDLKV